MREVEDRDEIHSKDKGAEGINKKKFFLLKREDRRITAIPKLHVPRVSEYRELKHYN